VNGLKDNDKKKIVYRYVIVGIIIAIVIYLTTIIYELVKKPTNIFVVENGKLTLEDETTRICN
jgi:hypothetical protein